MRHYRLVYPILQSVNQSNYVPYYTADVRIPVSMRRKIADVLAGFGDVQALLTHTKGPEAGLIDAVVVLPKNTKEQDSLRERIVGALQQEIDTQISIPVFTLHSDGRAEMIIDSGLYMSRHATDADVAHLAFMVMNEKVFAPQRETSELLSEVLTFLRKQERVNLCLPEQQVTLVVDKADKLFAERNAEAERERQMQVIFIRPTENNKWEIITRPRFPTYSGRDSLVEHKVVAGAVEAAKYIIELKEGCDGIVVSSSARAYEQMLEQAVKELLLAVEEG